MDFIEAFSANYIAAAPRTAEVPEASSKKAKSGLGASAASVATAASSSSTDSRSSRSSSSSSSSSSKPAAASAGGPWGSMDRSEVLSQLLSLIDPLWHEKDEITTPYDLRHFLTNVMAMCRAGPDSEAHRICIADLSDVFSNR